MDDRIEQKLIKAGDLREQEQFGESAKLYTECLIESLEKQDYSAQIHALCGQSLVYKIHARGTNLQTYKNLTLAFAKEALDIFEKNQDHIDPRTQSIALSSYADALYADGKASDALPYFEKSLAVSPAPDPEKGRLKAHIGGVKYLLGDKQNGINLINEGLAMIRTGDMTAYNIRVWETGALNSLAKIYAIEGDKEKAESVIQESLSIATTHNLSIRKRDAEDILQKISENRTDFSL
jgi:tetratricopeptide (TPR) repeat protein